MIDYLGSLGDLAPLMGIISITLILASEMFSLPYGRIALKLNRRKLRSSAILAALLFAVTMIAKVLAIIWT
jgi:hypothetical protein